MNGKEKKVLKGLTTCEKSLFELLREVTKDEPRKEF